MRALDDAACALYTAQRALRECAPNQRDYYPLEPAAWARAVAEHHARGEHLDAVYRELVTLYEVISDQVEARMETVNAAAEER